MRYDLFRFDLGRDPHAPAHAELSVFIVVLVAACGALVAASTLVALAHGWDYRFAVMLGAVPAAALAHYGWRQLPAERIADRLALATAGTLAAALLCTYAAEWLNWQPLGIDDAVAGLTIGLVLVVGGPMRRVLHHATQVPSAAGFVVVALALAPAAWVAVLHGLQEDVQDTADPYTLLAASGFVAGLAVTGLGFVLALRCRLYAAAVALSPVACVESMVLAGDSAGWGVVGLLFGTALMIAGANAWARSVRGGPLPLSHLPASVLIAAARARLVAPVSRVLRIAAPAQDIAALAAFAVLALVVTALLGLLGHYDLEYAILYPLIALPGCETVLAVAALAYLLALRRGLPRTALVASAAIGVHLFMLAFLKEVRIETTTVALLCAGIAAALLLAFVVAWGFSARAVRPGGVLAVLALTSAVAFLARLELIVYFLAAATLGVWWWFFHRRGTPLVAPGALERLGRRQPFLRRALAVALALTVGMHLLLHQAAVQNQTGAMVFEELAKYHLYPVSEATLARAILADQYLWRDSVSVARANYVEASAWWLLEKSRHPRDRWSDTYGVEDLAAAEGRKVTGVGFQSYPTPSGSLVRYVEGGSPAQRAGVRRGDVIRTIDGVALDGPNRPSWPSFERATRLELVSAAGQVREVSLVRGEYQRSAVSVERVIEVSARKVGYIELRNFLGEADEDFIDAAERLRGLGIDELVLDLRMNPGGRVYGSLRVASAIGGERLHGKTFKRLVHNERYRERDRDLVFRVPARGALSLSRVFIITSGRSCSASEGLINGLAPHMEVVTIGGTTCGKPVGSYSIDYGKTGFSVITFRGLNARGEGDYYDGLRPTCGAEDDPRRDFGDPEEASFKAALHYIRHGRCPEPSVPAGLL